MMIDKKLYINYSINYQFIKKILEQLNKKKINFFIDLQSISKGFYKKESVLYEVSHYAQNGEISDQYIYELKTFLNSLYKLFKEHDPFFILFYDDGKCIQNRMIMPSYKSGRSINNNLLLENESDVKIFKSIRKYYFEKISNEFNKENLSHVFYWKDYETDLLPHYCIINDYFDSNDKDVLNVILSIDKDLLQTCEYQNTIQCITSFIKDKKTGKFNIDFGIYDKNNAISYFHKTFKKGILTAKHVPIILSLAGDKSDEVDGIKGVGTAKAIKLISENNIPPTLSAIKNDINRMPKIIQDNISLITRNMKLIDFNEQIKRIPTKMF